MKAVKPIQRKPMIVHILDRLKLANESEEIIICTSTVPQDDPLEDIVIKRRGEMLSWGSRRYPLRLTNVAEEYKVDTVINCTGDNPFVDPEYIDLLTKIHIAHGYDFSKINGLPWGTLSYALTPSAMKKACEIKAERDTEVWHGYFIDTGHFKWSMLEAEDPEVL